MCRIADIVDFNGSLANDLEVEIIKRKEELLV